MSSPWVYSRCWTNSMEWPNTGLLCMPEMKPSTTWRARRSSRVILAMVSGCRKRRESSSRTAGKGKLQYQPAAQARGIRSLACAAGWSVRLRREDLLEAVVAGQLALLAGRLIEQPLDDGV